MKNFNILRKVVYIVAKVIELSFPLVLLGIPAYLGYRHVERFRQLMLLLGIQAIVLTGCYLLKNLLDTNLEKLLIDKIRLVGVFIISCTLLIIALVPAGLFHEIIHGTGKAGFFQLFLSIDFILPYIWSSYVLLGIAFHLETTRYIITEMKKNDT